MGQTGAMRASSALPSAGWVESGEPTGGDNRPSGGGQRGTWAGSVCSAIPCSSARLLRWGGRAFSRRLLEGHHSSAARMGVEPSAGCAYTWESRATARASTECRVFEGDHVAGVGR